jgi:hypothetical protein
MKNLFGSATRADEIGKRRLSPRRSAAAALQQRAPVRNDAPLESALLLAPAEQRR